MVNGNLKRAAMEEQEQARTPHVLIFPFPAQGHINSMLRLAELLSLQHFRITFLNTHHNHDRLSKFTDLRFTGRPGFVFQSIPDGLPVDHPRTGPTILDLITSMGAESKAWFRDILISSRETDYPVTCIVADWNLSFTIDVAEEFGIPTLCFRTVSACSFWAYFCIPKLIEQGDLPLKEGTDMDRVLYSIPGMEGLLRVRDLPSFCQVEDLDDFHLRTTSKETLNTTKASGLILNTFDDLESPILEQIRAHIPIIYTVGPLNAHLRSRSSNYSPSCYGCLWKEDTKCIKWLDQHAKKSVIYVSFGSVTVITRDEFLEFLYGLVNSGRPFLWVVRPGIVIGKGPEVPADLLKETEERGLLVEWAPQEDVLDHPSVGGFLTHGGWNSTLESVVAGIPMICWPYFADQQINSRFVSHVWKVGLDMKDRCSRLLVEKLVGELMAGKREKLEKAAVKMAGFARRSVSEGGSSYSNFERLVRDIKSLSLCAPSNQNKNCVA